MSKEPKVPMHPSFGQLTPEEFHRMKEAPESYEGNKYMEEMKKLARDRKQRKKKIKPEQRYMFEKE